MIYIANYWNDSTYKDIKVYSNCEEVELILNGKKIAHLKPDTGRVCNNLIHAPFTFKMPHFQPGVLSAKGYIKGQKVVECFVYTPETPSKIKISFDSSGKDLKAGCNDVIFVYASITDSRGTVAPADHSKLTFKVEGDASLIGPNSVYAESGIATILLKAGNRPGNIKVTAKATGLEDGVIQLTSK
jgi:beta-galactosidase